MRIEQSHSQVEVVKEGPRQFDKIPQVVGVVGHY